MEIVVPTRLRYQNEEMEQSFGPTLRFVAENDELFERLSSFLASVQEACEAFPKQLPRWKRAFLWISDPHTSLQLQAKYCAASLDRQKEVTIKLDADPCGLVIPYISANQGERLEEALASLALTDAETFIGKDLRREAETLHAALQRCNGYELLDHVYSAFGLWKAEWHLRHPKEAAEALESLNTPVVVMPRGLFADGQMAETADAGIARRPDYLTPQLHGTVRYSQKAAKSLVVFEEGAEIVQGIRITPENPKYRELRALIAEAEKAQAPHPGKS